MSGDTQGGVIWITGYPSAGKTSVASEVHTLLRTAGRSSVLLDGDNLRTLLAAKWGYSREERLELAHAYLALANYLARQGHVVVLAAVGMFREVEDWATANISRFLQIYLEVPYATRTLRARAQGKTVYEHGQSAYPIYDEPRHVVRRVNNSDGEDVQVIAQDIIADFEATAHKEAAIGRKKFWADFYNNSRGVLEASPFAHAVIPLLRTGGQMLEIGCGNGRDALFFSTHNQRVTATDISQEAINFCKRSHAETGIAFIPGHLPHLEQELRPQFDSVYSRFVLHSMTIEEENAVLASAYRLLKLGGTIHIECRSVNDPLALKGEVLSPTERLYGHYRRFIRRHELESKLQLLGFDIVNSVEASGLAVFGDEDPVVIRIFGEKIK